MLSNKFRRKIFDSQGQVKSLENSLVAYSKVYSQSPQSSEPQTIILLGLGSEPENILTTLALNSQIYYLECPDFFKQIPELSQVKIPELNKNSFFELLTKLKASQANFSIYYYQANSKLFPEFWLEILAQIKLITSPSLAQKECILIAGKKSDLLSYELLEACQENNYLCLLYDPKEYKLETLMAKFKIKLFLSVNMRSCSPEDYALLKAAKVPSAFWFVDNPYNVINPKLLHWQKANCFVSASNFIQDLQNMGVEKVSFLPLASSKSLATNMNKEKAQKQELDLLFVGRTFFPNFQSFFAKAKIQESLQKEAQSLIHKNLRPDFYWWKNKVTEPLLDISYNSELSNFAYRKFWLNSLASLNLTVVGDQTWQAHLDPKIQILPVVDYYNSLFSLYNLADFSLNLSSLQLGQALTQRHFDVWLAGGFLLSDYNQDLGIFSVDPKLYAATSPNKLKELLLFYQKNTQAKLDLQKQMQAEVLHKHQYKHRLEKILSV